MRDVAAILDTADEPTNYVLHGTGGESGAGLEAAITLSVAKRPGANAIDVVDRVLGKVNALRGTLLPADIGVTITRDYGHTAAEKSNELLLHGLRGVRRGAVGPVLPRLARVVGRDARDPVDARPHTPRFLPLRRRGPNVADIQINLVEKGERADQSHAIAKRNRPAVAAIAKKYGAAIAEAEVPPGPPVLQSIVAEIYGPNEEQRVALAREV